MLSANQEKCLRIINKVPLSFTQLALKLKAEDYQIYEIFDGEEMNSYITPTSDGKIKTSEPGKAALQQLTRDRCRFCIPLIISIVALIGAYRHELWLLIQALM